MLPAIYASFDGRVLGPQETATVGGKASQQGRGLPEGSAEALAQSLDPRQHMGDAEPVGVEQRSAAVARKPVAGEPDDVDIRWARLSAVW